MMKKAMCILLTVIMAVTLALPQRTAALSVKAASTIRFGGYDWLVLDIRDNHALIITENSIELRDFNQMPTAEVVEAINSGRDIQWEHSSIRNYLNGEFLNSFSQQDRARIRETNVSTGSFFHYLGSAFGEDGGYATVGYVTDRVFLLSVEEAMLYFSNEEHMERFIQAAVHAERTDDFQYFASFFSETGHLSDEYNSARISSAPTTDGRGMPFSWWLRSSGTRTMATALVERDGRIKIGGELNANSGGMRPALWLNLGESSAVATPQAPSSVTYIRNASDLAALSGRLTTGHFVLANDLTLTNWTPIENFSGTLDGAGHTITIVGFSDVNTRFATAGLFGTVTSGNVTVRNLNIQAQNNRTEYRAMQGNVRPIENGFRAYAPHSENSRAFAGGVIGKVIGGTVILENVSFDGYVLAWSEYSRNRPEPPTPITTNEELLEKLAEKAIDEISDMVIQEMVNLGMLPGWLSGVGTAIGVTIETINTIIDFSQNNDDFAANGSRAYAGGLIGFIGGDAHVTINNSFTRGDVRADTRTYIGMSAMVGAVRASAFAGGFVGFKAESASLDITNSYVTNNVHASAFESTVFSYQQDSNSGALVGRGSFYARNNFRLNTQNVSADRDHFIYLGGNTNETGLHDSLSNTLMRNPRSFTGWDFDNVWQIEADRNDGFPTLRATARNAHVVNQPGQTQQSTTGTIDPRLVGSWSESIDPHRPSFRPRDNDLAANVIYVYMFNADGTGFQYTILTAGNHRPYNYGDVVSDTPITWWTQDGSLRINLQDGTHFWTDYRFEVDADDGTDRMVIFSSVPNLGFQWLFKTR